MVGSGRACRRAWAGGAFHGQHGAVSRNVAQSRHHVEERAHVGRLFLHPYDFAGVGVLIDGGFQFCFVEGVHLVHEDDGRALILAALAFHAEFVPDLSGADQDAGGVHGACIRNDGQEALVREIGDGRVRVGMTQHALGREDDQRFAPVAQRLSAEQMEILGCV